MDLQNRLIFVFFLCCTFAPKEVLPDTLSLGERVSLKKSLKSQENAETPKMKNVDAVSDKHSRHEMVEKLLIKGTNMEKKQISLTEAASNCPSNKMNAKIMARNNDMILRSIEETHAMLKEMTLMMNDLRATVTDLKVKSDKFEIERETAENKRKILAYSHGGLKFLHHERDTSADAFEEAIHDVKRAAYLLAVSKISFADLPYMSNCGIRREGNMETCLQTRVEKLYDDLNTVMDFHVMLVGGEGPHEGRVEIVFRGRHGTVCDYYWDIVDANVVCRMLGYREAEQRFWDSYFGNGEGEILLDKVNCKGEEGSLLACPHLGIMGTRSVGIYCNHRRDAGVRCKTT